MPSLNEMFPSKYLKAEDLRGKDGKGWREFKLKIKTLAVEQVSAGDEDNPPESKWVLHFEGAQKGMVLNKTNAQTIAEAYGSNSDEWIGEEIVLFVMTVSTPQGQKPGIRVRIPSKESFDPEAVPA